MESAFLIVGSVALWVYIASRTTNPFVKQYMFLTSVIMTAGLSWIAWLSLDQTELIALSWWRYSMTAIFSAWLLIYGALWVTGSLEKEEIDNGF